MEVTYHRTGHKDERVFSFENLSEQPCLVEVDKPKMITEISFCPLGPRETLII